MAEKQSAWAEQRRVPVVDKAKAKTTSRVKPYRTPAQKANIRNLILLTFLVAAVCLVYLTINSYPEKPELFRYILSLRVPTLIVMLIAAFAIGGASIVFQSIINNRIVTPCLLGMNSMYTLVHTAVVFAVGSGSRIATNSNLSFAIDLVLMSIVATFIYSYMFKKTGNNVLYVLLIGTVLSSFFGSIQSTMIRVMDPNEYDTLLTTLVADFNNVNSEVIAFSLILILLLVIFLRKDLALLDVITLGKDQAINLGVLGAKEVIENDLIKELDVYKDGKIVYFIEHANVWYTSTGGIQALDTMLADLEGALLQ